MPCFFSLLCNGQFSRRTKKTRIRLDRKRCRVPFITLSIYSFTSSSFGLQLFIIPLFEILFYLCCALIVVVLRSCCQRSGWCSENVNFVASVRKQNVSNLCTRLRSRTLWICSVNSNQRYWKGMAGAGATSGLVFSTPETQLHSICTICQCEGELKIDYFKCGGWDWSILFAAAKGYSALDHCNRVSLEKRYPIAIEGLILITHSLMWRMKVRLWASITPKSFI